MRNLKRVLSLVMTVALIAGLMIVGAGAAYKDFTDKDKINNKIAVETLVELNVISGKEDGSYYDPEGLLTRAEATKLVCFVLNGGKEPVLGDPSLFSFNDVKGHWAAKYIEYVASLGIVAGDGAGNFKPEENLTATQLAKMLLVALDYDAEFEGLVGSAWSAKTDALANQKGLYDGEGLDNLITSAPLNRDNAAQIIYNVLTAHIVRYTSEGNGNVGVKAVDTDETMLGKYFKTAEVVGIVLANDVFAVDNKGEAADGKMRIDVGSVDDVETDSNQDNEKTLPIAVDNDLVGQEVTVFVKDYNKTNQSVIGAVVATENNTVATTMDDMDPKDSNKDAKDFLKDNGLNTALAGATVVENGTVSATAAITALESHDKRGGVIRTVIDNDADSAVEFIIVTEKVLTKVTKYNTSDKELTLKGMDAGNTDLTVDFADVVAYDGIQKDDLVLAVSYNNNNKVYIEKVETVTGEVTAYNHSNDKITVDGTVYAASALENKVTNEVDSAVVGGNVDFDESMIGTTYTLYLDNAKNVIAYAEPDDAVKNYALVIASNADVNMLGEPSGTVKLLLADGSTVTYDSKVDLEASANKFLNDGYTAQVNGDNLSSTNKGTSTQKKLAMASLLTSRNNSGKNINGGADITGVTKDNGKTGLYEQIVTYTVTADGEVVLAPVDSVSNNTPAVTPVPDVWQPVRTNGIYDSGATKAAANSSTIYFFYDVAEDEGSVITGLQNLPLDSDNVIVQVAYTTKDSKNTATAVYVRGGVEGDSTYVYVLENDTEVSGNLFRHTVTDIDGNKSTVTTKSAIGQKGLYELGKSGSNDTLDPIASPADGGNYLTIDRVTNSMLLTTTGMAKGTPFAKNVKVLDATDKDALNVIKVTDLDEGDIVSFVLNSDDEISEIYLVKEA